MLLPKAEDREEQIFSACYNLQNANYKSKIKFANNNAKNENEKSLFFEYLKIKPLNIEYDETFFIKSFVS